MVTLASTPSRISQNRHRSIRLTAIRLTRSQTLITTLAIALCQTVLHTQAIAQSANPAQARTIFENVTLTPSFTNTTLHGISGGGNLSSDLIGRTETATGACTGFIDEQPDHTMQLTQPFNFLSLQVQSNADTTLVIRGPGGTWCNDDYTDKNPGIAGQWLSGVYQIWIGSYAENVYNPYVIRVTEQQ
jgi:hypothetical protein